MSIIQRIDTTKLLYRENIYKSRFDNRDYVLLLEYYNEHGDFKNISDKRINVMESKNVLRHSYQYLGIERNDTNINNFLKEEYNRLQLIKMLDNNF